MPKHREIYLPFLLSLTESKVRNVKSTVWNPSRFASVCKLLFPNRGWNSEEAEVHLRFKRGNKEVKLRWKCGKKGLSWALKEVVELISRQKSNHRLETTIKNRPLAFYKTWKDGRKRSRSNDGSWAPLAPRILRNLWGSAGRLVESLLKNPHTEHQRFCRTLGAKPSFSDPAIPPKHRHTLGQSKHLRRGAISPNLIQGREIRVPIPGPPRKGLWGNIAGTNNFACFLGKLPVQKLDV